MHRLSQALSHWAPPERTHISTLAGLCRLALRCAIDSVSNRGASDRATRTTSRAIAAPLAVRPVMLVGAGPGDPDLLTLKALRALTNADVVLYDRLVSREVLALVPAHVERIGVGKRGHGPACRQDEINRLMVALALAGRRIVRLKAGDPLMFARLEEEIAALEAAQVDFEIVPGISAAQGAASRLKAPLTGRQRSRRFQAITGHGADGCLPRDFDWAGLADAKATTAVYMPKATIGALCSELLARGLAADHPAAAVFNATRASEVVLTATLATLPQAISAAEGDAPCIILIGHGVARRAVASPSARKRSACPAFA